MAPDGQNRFINEISIKAFSMVTVVTYTVITVLFIVSLIRTITVCVLFYKVIGLTRSISTKIITYIMDFSPLHKEVTSAVEADSKNQRENDAKIRAVQQKVETYDQFE